MPSSVNCQVDAGRFEGVTCQDLAFYNQGRPHSSLDGRTPDEAYFGTQAMVMAA
ncbi:hypothetical protein ACVME9_007551 [Bradyrhizobium liaoningense]